MVPGGTVPCTNRPGTGNNTKITSTRSAYVVLVEYSGTTIPGTALRPRLGHLSPCLLALATRYNINRRHAPAAALLPFKPCFHLPARFVAPAEIVSNYQPPYHEQKASLAPRPALALAGLALGASSAPARASPLAPF